MKEQLRIYLDQLLEDIPKTKKVLELKEEILGNMEERYEDLVKEGYQKEDSYHCVVDSMGDIRELFEEFTEVETNGNLGQKAEENKKKRAVLTTIATGLYFFGMVVFFALAMIGESWYGFNSKIDWVVVGAITMMLICIAPTCMLVYAAHMYPKYKKGKDTVVEEFKQWKHEIKRSNEQMGAISVIVWLSTVILYFIVSFRTGAWNMTWLIFLVGGCVQVVVYLRGTMG